MCECVLGRHRLFAARWILSVTDVAVQLNEVMNLEMLQRDLLNLHVKL